jgi:transcriptional regulator with PAS, ATPase and Fis domain
LQPKILLLAPSSDFTQMLKTALEAKGCPASINIPDASFTNPNPGTGKIFDLIILFSHYDAPSQKEGQGSTHKYCCTFFSSSPSGISATEAIHSSTHALAHPEDIAEIADSILSLLSRLQPSFSSLAATKSRALLPQPPFLPELIGASPQMQAARMLISKISKFPGVPVLITGETGTGKDLVANLLHRSSARANKPFVKVNCGSIPDALFESIFFGHLKGAFTGAVSDQKGLVDKASGGTLFLDEIGTLGLEQQPKLLQVLDEGSFLKLGESRVQRANSWMIAATNEKLETLIHEGQFRRDLYYRLKGGQVHLSALRFRKEDIAPLTEHFLLQFALNFGVSSRELSKQALALLQEHDWPGNVRELKYVIFNAMATREDGKLVLDQLRLERLITTPPSGTEKTRSLALFEVEKNHIQTTFQQTGFNRKRTAKLLGISLNALKRRLERYGLR